MDVPTLETRLDILVAIEYKNMVLTYLPPLPTLIMVVTNSGQMSGRINILWKRLAMEKQKRSVVDPGMSGRYPRESNFKYSI